MKIPLDPVGWSVSSEGTIHTRYNTHATGDRTRTEKGVETLLNGNQGRACVECYGNNPHYPDTTPRPAQQRRISTNPPNASMSLRKNGDGPDAE